jgi:hypothetical protein
MTPAAVFPNPYCSGDERRREDHREPASDPADDIDIDRFIDDGNPIHPDEVDQRRAVQAGGES